MFDSILHTLEGQGVVNRTSFSEIKKRIGGLVPVIRRETGGKRSNVLLLVFDAEAFISSYLGVVFSGGVPVLVDPGLNREAILKMYRDNGCALALTDAGGKASFEGMDVNVLSLSDPPEYGVDDFWELPGKNDVCCIVSTSGSTGERICHAKTTHNLAVEMAEFTSFYSFSKRDVFLTNLPLSHIYGMIWSFLLPLYAGASVHIHTGAFPRALTEAAEEIGPTVFCTVPVFYRHLCELEGSQSLGFFQNVRLFTSSGDRLPEETAVSFKKVSGKDITGIYGMTETGALFHGSLYPGSDLGTGMDYIECRIEGGKKTGDLLVRGPNLLEPGRFFNTGDVVKYENGRYFYVDRSKRIIKSGARSIFPGEIEKILRRSDLVKDVFVKGKPDLIHGQIVQAIVVLEKAVNNPVSLLRNHCETFLSGFEMPREFVIVDNIKRDQRGKIVKDQEY